LLFVIAKATEGQAERASRNRRMNEYKKIQNFSDLIVWQKGHRLVLLIYRYTEDFPKRVWFGLADQI
jgi:hypothetical protein